MCIILFLPPGGFLPFWFPPLLPMIIFHGDKHLNSNIIRISPLGVFVIAISHSFTYEHVKFLGVPNTVL